MVFGNASIIFRLRVRWHDYIFIGTIVSAQGNTGSIIVLALHLEAKSIFFLMHFFIKHVTCISRVYDWFLQGREKTPEDALEPAVYFQFSMYANEGTSRWCFVCSFVCYLLRMQYNHFCSSSSCETWYLFITRFFTIWVFRTRYCW